MQPRDFESVFGVRVPVEVRLLLQGRADLLRPKDRYDDDQRNDVGDEDGWDAKELKMELLFNQEVVGLTHGDGYYMKCKNFINCKFWNTSFVLIWEQKGRDINFNIY